MDSSLFKIFSEYGSYVVFGAISAWLIIDSRLQSNKLVEILSTKLDEVRLAVWRKTHNPEETINVVKEKVWYASIAKLDYIREVLINNHIAERKEEIKDNIRTKLEELSQEYIQEFNTFNTPIVRLGDVVGENFEFNPFFEEVMKVVYRDTKNSNAIELKLKDIESIMRKYQNRMGMKLMNIMNKKCTNCFQANGK